MLHSGIDLHKRTVVISTVDTGGRPVRAIQYFPEIRTFYRTHCR